MKFYKDGNVIFNSIDNLGETDEASLGSRYAFGRIGSTHNHLIQNHYDKSLTVTEITDAINNANLLKAVIVPAPPAVEDAKTNVMYLVPVTGQENVYAQFQKVLVSRNPDEYQVVQLGDTAIEAEGIQVDELPLPTGAVGNKVKQYIDSDLTQKGWFYWCAPKTYYAWDYVSGGTSADEGTYYVEKSSPAAGDDIYTGTWTSGVFYPTSVARAVSIGETLMTDNRSFRYRREDTKDIIAYHWVRLLTKTSEFENDGNGVSKFVTQTRLTSALTPKQNIITGGSSSIVTNNLTASRAVSSNSSGKVGVSSVTSTEMGYLSGVTSGIQAQLDAISSAGGSVTQFTPSLNNPSGAMYINSHSLWRITIGNRNFLTGYIGIALSRLMIYHGWNTFTPKLNFTLWGNTFFTGNLSYVDKVIVPGICWDGTIAIVSGVIVEYTTPANAELQMTIGMVPLRSWS